MSDAPDAADDSVKQPSEQVSTYIESPIISATVRMVAPFVMTYGLFIMFHGADSAGGGFQGGVIVATVVFMLGIAFGIDNTREWLDTSSLVVLVGLGLFVFLGIGVGTVVLGGEFLDYDAIGIYHASKYGIEAVELAIGLIVASVISGLFFAIDADYLGGDSE